MNKLQKFKINSGMFYHKCGQALLPFAFFLLLCLSLKGILLQGSLLLLSRFSYKI